MSAFPAFLPRAPMNKTTAFLVLLVGCNERLVEKGDDSNTKRVHDLALEYDPDFTLSSLKETVRKQHISLCETANAIARMRFFTAEDYADWMNQASMDMSGKEIQSKPDKFWNRHFHDHYIDKVHSIVHYLVGTTGCSRTGMDVSFPYTMLLTFLIDHRPNTPFEVKEASAFDLLPRLGEEYVALKTEAERMEAVHRTSAEQHAKTLDELEEINYKHSQTFSDLRVKTTRFKRARLSLRKHIARAEALGITAEMLEGHKACRPDTGSEFTRAREEFTQCVGMQSKTQDGEASIP